jgi:disulfide bond formation protein DsbB
MNLRTIDARTVAMLAGAYGTAMILGALGFQYLGGIVPCEMCHWQRWGHIAAGVIGLVGAAILDRKYAPWLAWTALACIAISGLIGAYQAGMEWHFLPGPESCTGSRFTFEGLNGLDNEHAVRCDVVQWSLFGISLAGYDALFSLGAAGVGAFLLLRKKA